MGTPMKISDSTAKELTSVVRRAGQESAAMASDLACATADNNWTEALRLVAELRNVLQIIAYNAPLLQEHAK